MKKPAAPDWEVQQLDTDALLLDPANPRLADFGLESNASQEEIAKQLWHKMAVDEVALSIAENGFYPHEPLYAVKENGSYIVIEGNRRLAAVKLLRDKNLRGAVRASGLPHLSLQERRHLDTLPVILCKRDDVWAYLGFKHINGPQAWESFPKATYIAWVHNKLGISLEQIASHIGDKHSTVARLYDGLMVLEQSEKARVFDRGTMLLDTRSSRQPLNEPAALLWDESIRIGSDELTLKQLLTPVAKRPTIDLRSSIVLAQPWERWRLQRAFANIGTHGTWGPWRQDENHVTIAWLPWPIVWISNGNHSIVAGTIAAGGRLKVSESVDATRLLGAVRTDGVSWIDEQNDEKFA